MASSPEKDAEIDWTALWAKKYPVLSSYQGKIDSVHYEGELLRLLSSLEKEGLSRLDAFLVLKDILWRLCSKSKREPLNIAAESRKTLP